MMDNNFPDPSDNADFYDEDRRYRENGLYNGITIFDDEVDPDDEMLDIGEE